MTRIKSDNVQIGSSYVLPIENPYKEEEARLKRMILAAQKEKDRIIQEGVAKAKELVDEAKEIITQAQQQATQIVETATNEANAQSTEIKETAQKEGYDTGYKQGYDDGTNSLEEKFMAIDTFAQSQFDLKHNIIKSAQLDIVELVIAIARKVCQKSLENDVNVLKDMTIEAIKQLKDKENITITINPELAEKIYSISEDLKESIPKLQNIKVIEDDNVSADGTIVETLLSRVDNRLKIQIDQIAEKFLTTHYSASHSDELNEEVLNSEGLCDDNDV